MGRRRGPGARGPTWWRRRGLEVVGIVCGFGLLCSALAVLSYPADVRDHDLALRLRAHGVAATATSVDLHVALGFRHDGVDAVRVAFPVEGRTVVTDLAAAYADVPDGVTQDGWVPAPADDVYAAPLRVVHLPTDPRLAMAAEDVDHHADDSLREARSWAVGGVVPSLVVGAVWAARRWRRRS